MSGRNRPVEAKKMYVDLYIKIVTKLIYISIYLYLSIYLTLSLSDTSSNFPSCPQGRTFWAVCHRLNPRYQ